MKQNHKTILANSWHTAYLIGTIDWSVQIITLQNTCKGSNMKLEKQLYWIRTFDQSVQNTCKESNMNFILDSLHRFCTDWSIIPIKYSSLSAVCTYCTTLLHVYSAQHCAVLHAYCTKQLIYGPTLLHIIYSIAQCTLFQWILLIFFAHHTFTCIIFLIHLVRVISSALTCWWVRPDRAHSARAIPAKAMQKWDLSPCLNKGVQQCAIHKQIYAIKQNILHIIFNVQ